jgi:hypothetical protein
MFRGDHRDQGFTVTVGGEPIDFTGAALIFSVKEKEDDAVPLFQRKNALATGSSDEIEMTDPTNGKFTVKIIPSNTESLDGNQSYWYDIQMIKNSKTLTLIKNKIHLVTDITT